MQRFGITICLSLFLLAGCSKNYLAEREFFKAEKVYKTATAQAEVQGASAYEPAILAFKNVFEKHPGTPKALDSLFYVADLYEKQKKYAESREILKKVGIDFSNDGPRAAQARFRIAQLFEKENEWGQAEHMYWETSEYYPIEAPGLQAPIQVILHYISIKYQDAADRVYRQSIEHYEKLVDQLGPIETSARVRNYMAITHTVMGKWTEARAEWIAISNDFKDKPVSGVALIAAAEVSQKIGQSALALSLYKQFVDAHPKDVLAGQIYVRMGLIYHQSGAFDDAVANYEKALISFGEDKVQTSDVKLLIGRAYQAQGDWVKADEVYRDVEVKNPKTSAALQIPLLRANYYEEHGEKEKATQIRNEAVRFYQELAFENPNTTLEKFAQRLISDAHKAETDWQQTLKYLDEAIAKTSAPEKKGELTLMKAIIADKQLKDKTLALKLYDDFLTHYASHSLAATAKNYRDLLSKS